MDFITQYLTAQSGNAVPTRYTQWCALHLLMLAAGRKFFFDHEHFAVEPQFYLCLLGDPASLKTTAMEAAQRMWQKVAPDYPEGASASSREEIIRLMAKQDKQGYTNWKGEPAYYTPRAFYVNELENFLSVAKPEVMLQLLTDIYGRARFVYDTVKRGREVVEYPFLTVLACTVPSFFTTLFQQSTIGNGILRRILFIYEPKPPDRITFPKYGEVNKEAHLWCVAHLQKVFRMQGARLTMTDAARKALDDFNQTLKDPPEGIFKGYHGTKDILTIQVAILLSLAQEKIPTVITDRTVEQAIAWLLSNEDSLPLMEMMAGRNELLNVQYKLLQRLRSKGGGMSEKAFHKWASLDLKEQEYIAMLGMLEHTGQIKRSTLGRVTPAGGQVSETWILLPDKSIEVFAEAQANLKKLEGQ